MRATHKSLTPARHVKIISLTMLMLICMLLAFAPAQRAAAARHALATRISASLTTDKILSIAPASVRTAIRKRFAPVASNNAAAAASMTKAAVSYTPYSISKSATPPSGSSVGQGQIITYTITVTNGGTADTTSGNGFIRIFDTSTQETLFQFNPAFPTGVMTQPGAGSAWGCTITPNGNGTNQFTCYAGDGIGGGADTFAANATVVFKVDALVSPAATPASVKNNTSFFEKDGDGNGVDEVFIGSNTVSHIIAPAADLGITKSAQTAQPALPDPQNSVLAGGISVAMANLGSIGNEGRGNISYVLTVTNIGPADATNVVIEDSIPGGPVQLAGVNAAPQDLPVAGPVPGQPIIPADLGVTGVSISDDTGGPPVGTATTFAIGCHNFGAGEILTCKPGNNIAIDPGYIAGILPAGFQARIAYRLRVLASATLNSIISDSARISSNGSVDINAGNNTSLPTQNVVITKADLGISKATSNPTPVAGGAAFSYTLTVTNNGPSDAKNIVVTDPLPAGVIIANSNVAVVNNPAIAGYGLICTGPPNGTNGTVICTGSLPGPDPNTMNVSTSTITIVAQIVPNVASGVRFNTATVISDTQEPTPNVAPNTATVRQDIEVNAPLSITKTGPATLCPGQLYTYKITVNNGGNSTALNATISDPLPPNTTFVSQDGTGAFNNSCAFNGGVPGTVTCSAVDIPQGQHELNITVKLSPNAPSGPLANTATITSAGTGTIANGTSTSTAQVQQCATLNVTKIVQSGVTVASNPNQTGPIGPASPDNGTGTTGTAVIPGTRMTYRINVTNAGPSPVSNLRVLDILPANVKYVSAIQSSGFSTIFTCQAPLGIVDPNGYGGQLQCTAPVMSATAPDNVATLDIVVDIDPATKVTIANNVNVNATINNTTQQTSTKTTLNTPVQPVSDLTLTKTAVPDSVFPGTNTTYTLVLKNLGPSVAAMPQVIDPLPAGQTLVAADVSGAPGFACTGTTTITCSAASLGVGATAVIKLIVRIGDDVPAGMYFNTATATSMSLDPTPATATAKLTVVVKSNGEPGKLFPVISEVSDQKAGSILFFPIYTSDAVNSNKQNTRISMTNLSNTDSVCIHLFAVDGASCSVADMFVCLSKTQTTTFLASDLDPGNSGYMMAIAVDCETGLPKAFNCLIGDEYVKFSSNHAANLGAEAISSVAVFPVGTGPIETTATLKFDGNNYNRLPRVLALDNIPSAATNSTLLIINRVGGNLSNAGATIGSITGLVYDDVETAYSFTANVQSCQYRAILSNTFPRTLTQFTRVIPANRTGWMKFWAVEDKALFGAMINYNANTGSSSEAFNQGHNLHKLTLTDTTTIVVPVYPPSCNF